MAVAKFPAFCGEGDDLKVTCTKELAAVFAHATDLTGTGEDDGGLNHIENAECAGGQGKRSDGQEEVTDCYKSEDWAWNLWTQP